MKKAISILLAVTSISCCAMLSGCKTKQAEVFALPREYKLSFSEE